MVWMLLYIIIELDTVNVGQMGMFKTMAECFEARDELVLAVGKDGYFPTNQQAICIKSDKTI